MLRSVGIYLLIVPLLLPPGVCVCDVVSNECAACDETLVVVPAPVTGCRCKCHQQTPAPSFHLGHTCIKGQPIDAPDNHVPGCPAKHDQAQWKTQPNHPPTLTGPVAVSPFVLVEPALTVSRAWSPDQSGHPPDQPLYLTLLTLLI